MSTDSSQARYLELQLPARFVLEGLTPSGEWLEWGRFTADWFQRQPDGAYLCAGHGGSPVWLRCVRREDDGFTVVDGAGDRHRRRMRAL